MILRKINQTEIRICLGLVYTGLNRSFIVRIKKIFLKNSYFFAESIYQVLSLSNVSPGPFLAFVYENSAKQCHHYKLQFTMHIWEISNMFVDCVKTELKNLDDDSDSNNGNFYFRRRFLSCPQDSRRPSSYFWICGISKLSLKYLLETSFLVSIK